MPPVNPGQASSWMNSSNDRFLRYGWITWVHAPCEPHASSWMNSSNDRLLQYGWITWIHAPCKPHASSWMNSSNDRLLLTDRARALNQFHIIYNCYNLKLNRPCQSEHMEQRWLVYVEQQTADILLIPNIISWTFSGAVLHSSAIPYQLNQVR